MELTRAQFMDLMGFVEGDEGMMIADEEHETNEIPWFEIAKDTIVQLNFLLQEAYNRR